MSAYRVGDDQDVGLGGVLSGGLCEIADDGGVGVEQVWVPVSREAANNTDMAYRHGSFRACEEHQRG